MKNVRLLEFAGLLILLFAAFGVNAQMTVEQNPTFTTTGQDWYKPGPGAPTPVLGKDYLFDGALKGFFDASFGIPSVLEIKAKTGFAFDMFTDIKSNSGGKVDVNFPVKVEFTHPTDRTYGCGEEIAITSTCSVNSGYQLNSTPPVFEMELGVQAKAGAYFGYVDPFSSHELSDLAATGQSFEHANSSNYESLMAGGDLPFFGLHTQNGVKWPWQYNPDISAPGGAIPNNLPLTIPNFIVNAVHLSGTIDKPFTENPSDVFMGTGNKVVMESGTRKFLDLSFDPIQFQSRLTGFPMKHILSIPGIFSLDYTIFGVPFNFQAFKTHKLKFSPSVDIQVQLNRIYDYKVRDASNNIVTSGTGTAVTMKAGHTLLLRVPNDNQPIAFTPTYKLTNEFTTHIRDSVRINVGIEVLKMKLTTQPVLLCNPLVENPDPEDDCVELIEAGMHTFGPAYSNSTNIAAFGVDAYPETTFQMGGFTDIAGATIIMKPDDAPPVATFTNPVFALDSYGQFVVNSVTQVTSSLIDADGGAVAILNQPTVTYTCNDLGAKTYTFTATDGRCNGKVYNAPITIIDNLKPTVLVKPAFDLELDANGQASITVASIDNGSFDNCTIVSRTLNKYTFDCTNVGPNTITLTVTDQSNNTHFLSTTVNVVDRRKPILNCSNGTVVFNGETQIPLVISDLVTASDNCGVAGIVLNPAVITCAQLGSIVPILITVTDNNNNVETCTVNVTVNGLPCGWSQQPNGAGCIDGSAVSYNVPAASWGLVSEDCYYANPFTADELAFAQYQLCGNGSLTAKVTNINGGGGWAGIVMRESNAAGAKKVQLMTNLGSNLTRREVRATTNGASQPQQFPAQNRPWLRLVRTGNQFVGYASPNGAQWYPELTATVPMNACIQIGLISTNNEAISTLNSGFSNVSTSGSSVATLSTPGNDLPATATTHTPQNLTVYPNPTSTEATVELTPFMGQSIRLAVYNSLGMRMVYQKMDEVQTQVERLDLSGFEKGFYLISVETSAGERFSSKLIVQ